MGVSKSPEELAIKFDKLGSSFDKAGVEAVKATALTYKDGALRAARADVGSDLKMSWSGRNIKLGARFKTYGNGANQFAVLTPVPAGIWSALSNGTKAHTIYPGAKKPGRKRRNGRKALAFPNGGFSGGPVEHPGTPGKRTWQRGIASAKPGARTAFKSAYTRAMVRVFR